MRRLLMLAAAAWLAVRLWRRRSRGPTTSVVVGYADGSSISLDGASADRDSLVELARTALTR